MIVPCVTGVVLQACHDAVTWLIVGGVICLHIQIKVNVNKCVDYCKKLHLKSFVR